MTQPDPTTARRFGLTVQRHKPWDGEPDPDAGWNVFLPHQCDSWDIAGDHPFDGEPHDDAVKALEAFIAEAQEALTALRDSRAYGDADA